jgi:hypothetical protein
MHLLSFVLAFISAAQPGLEIVVLRRVQSEKTPDNKLDQVIMRALPKGRGFRRTPDRTITGRNDGSNVLARMELFERRLG